MASTTVETMICFWGPGFGAWIWGSRSSRGMFSVWDAGFRVLGSGFQVLSSGFRVPGSGFRVPGSGFRVPSFGSRDPGFVFRAPGAGFRVPGSGFRLPGSAKRPVFPWHRAFGFRVYVLGKDLRIQIQDRAFRVRNMKLQGLGLRIGLGRVQARFRQERIG